MPSRVLPLEDLKQRSVMYWLPPGGRDNGVWADTWVIMAELEAADSAAVLTLLAQADVGGYVATPGGRRTVTTTSRHLYVDREQHNHATDVLMLFLRGKDPSVATVTASMKTTTTPKTEPSGWSVVPATVKQLIMREPVRTVIKVLVAATLIALGLIFVYYEGPPRRHC